MLITALLLCLPTAALGVAAGWALAQHHATAAYAGARVLTAPVAEALARLEAQVARGHETDAATRLQLGDVAAAAATLQRETSALATALARPQVRGAWGELHLRRAVELAGLVERCDFASQVTVTRADGSVQRPDLVVSLPGGGRIAVDAKAPMTAFLAAAGTPDEARAGALLGEHAAALRAHVRSLAAKSYTEAVGPGPGFVVLFVPAESFLGPALERDPALLDDAAARGVLLATPVTLIALLRTVALAWHQHAFAEDAQEVLAAGRELHGRLATLGAHLDGLGRALTKAVVAFNGAAGSLERSVLPQARRFHRLQVAAVELSPPDPVEELPRSFTSTELAALGEPPDPVAEHLREVAARAAAGADPGAERGADGTRRAPTGGSAA